MKTAAPTLHRRPRENAPPSEWTHTVNPGRSPSPRVSPDVFEIRFKPPKTNGLGTIELVIGSKVAVKIGLGPDPHDASLPGRPGAILRISTDLRRGRLEAVGNNVIGALKVLGRNTLRIKAAGASFPVKVAEAIAYATRSDTGSTFRPPIALDYKVRDGGLEFDLPTFRAQPVKP